MKLNLGRPEELVVYYSYETVLMHSPFLISSSGESILLKGLFVRVYLLPAYTCTFLASWREDQKEVTVAQGIAGTNEDKVNSNV